MNRGEVWWGEDPELGRRPYLVITRASAIPVLERVLAVPATQTIRGVPTEIVLTEEDGMPKLCALSFDNVTTVPKAFLTKRICRLGGERLVEVCRVLQYATGC